MGNDSSAINNGALQLGYVLKLCFVSGFSLGLIAAPFYAYQYFLKLQFIDFLISILLIPIANGISVVICGLIGYPVYLYLVRCKKFGFYID